MCLLLFSDFQTSASLDFICANIARCLNETPAVDRVASCPLIT